MTRLRPSRRSVLAASTALFAAPAILRAQNLNSKLNIAAIAVGGRGGANLSAVAASEDITALCDVNAQNLAAAATKHPKAKTFADFRDLFDKAHKDFDAVVVSTCEHTHAHATLLALKAGKHVYCEKPLTHNIWEARQIRTAAAANPRLATQMGVQIHAGENYRKVVELIRAGAIGPVREAHVWVSRAWGLQSEADSKKNKDLLYVANRPPDAKPVPAHLNWDLWLGPAPARPFHDVYFPGPKWYRWWDFGSGTMSDLGSHWNDLPFWALNLDAPKFVEAAGPPAHAEIAPATMSATYEYAPRGDMPALKLTWHQGESKPKLWEDKAIPQWPNGCLFVGDAGMLLSDYSKHLLLPEAKFADYKRPDPTIPRVKSHHQEWVDACKTGATCSANFDYAARLTEANHLGNVAYRLGQRIEWDAADLKCPNTPAADKFIKREYRKGWELL
ncbi:MAG TPA: Gfo/Idh/MocA family oxidoreductase [Tepidisphaeraceae bacterium]|nr:Gfo/Idh/MocA family oxidoreductase [Tepidisphaeraceae bacterium]